MSKNYLAPWQCRNDIFSVAVCQKRWYWCQPSTTSIGAGLVRWPGSVIVTPIVHDDGCDDHNWLSQPYSPSYCTHHSHCTTAGATRCSSDTNLPPTFLCLCPSRLSPPDTNDDDDGYGYRYGYGHDGWLRLRLRPRRMTTMPAMSHYSDVY